MISFDDLRLDNQSPIYLQLLKAFKQQCASGMARDGDAMPSRRALSAVLGVNPNTVQKAYRMLEEEGLIASRGGAKSVVTLSEAQIADIREELLRNEMTGAVKALRSGGVTKEEALALFGRFWDEIPE